MRIGRGSGAQDKADVVVAGTGGAGLVAALAARCSGKTVTLIEASSWIGGTTSVSGGVIWVPCNSHMIEAGRSDSRTGALEYLAAVAGESADRGVLERLVEKSPEMLGFLEANTDLTFNVLGNAPDYRPELPGAQLGGRGLEVAPFDATQLGELARYVRMSPHYPSLTLAEMKAAVYDPFSMPWDRAAERMETQERTLGSGLVCGLLAACIKHGVSVRRQVRGRCLIMDGDRVAGLEAEDVAGARVRLRATSGVVLATGGFEWNDRMLRQLLAAGHVERASAPGGNGDGHRMAWEAGAAASHLSDAWWEPVCCVPGETWPEGQALYRLNIAERTLPGSILVNKAGQRFANEAMNYHDLTRIMLQQDTHTGQARNNPAWLIFDERFRSKYVVLTAMPDSAAPAWMISASSLAELGERIGIDRSGLQETVTIFNKFAEDGVDRDFHRGENPYDLYQADPRNRPNPSLGAIDAAPFYAIPTYAGLVGTKGGLEIDRDARVLDFDGNHVHGLFACGNLVAGAITGAGLAGPGGTIGPALTFGYIAGKAAAAA